MDTKIKLENIPVEVLQSITTQQAWYYHLIPYEVGAGEMKLFIGEEKDVEEVKNEFSVLTGKKIFLLPVLEQQILEALARFYRRSNKDVQERQNLYKAGEEGFLEQLIVEARELGSSDIHIEPYEESCRVRFRIDGALVARMQLEKKHFPSIVNKIKIKANIDISEKRLPQDGRILFKKTGADFDIRVSSLPTLHGEKIVMRLLGTSTAKIELDQLGFQAGDIQTYLENIRKSNGMVLISGPTGSGKTTTLYATLNLLNEPERNILTIEDPIEYTIEGINQVQLKEAIGLDFASAMRTFLRQDPDIIMVGEIRDVATASMAIRASLTGHLVLSTIHTNSAWGIVSRLIDMGVPAYLLADTLNAAVAQRLIRILCPKCKRKQDLMPEAYPVQFKPSTSISFQYQAVGCPSCHYTGYKGRTAILEVIPINAFLKEKIKNVDLKINDYLKENKINRLADNAFSLFQKGETSLSEVYPIFASIEY